MGAHSGTKTITNGLTHLFDASSVDGNPWKHNRSNILPSWLTWNAGVGNPPQGYSANGSSSEQSRTWYAGAENDQGIATPYNPTWIAPIESEWRTVPDATSGADGGWNSSYYLIDRNYTYRWSVWVKRHAQVGGTFYMGLNPPPIRNDNGATQSNPYFTYPAISSLTQNVWYLVVGHCFYEGYTGGRHPDSGWYELKTNSSLNGDINARYLEKIPDKSYGNVGDQDVRWASTTTQALHRTYHYYTTNTSSGLTFAYPRLDKCDGTEPTIGQLCTNAKVSLKNLVGTAGHMGIRSHIACQSLSYATDPGTGAEYIHFNGSNVGSGGVMYSDFDYRTTDCTVVAITRYNGSTRGRIISGLYNNWLLGHHSNSTGDFYAEGWVRNNATTDTNWGIYVATCQVSTDQYSLWINGEKIVTNSTAGSAGPNGLSLFHYDPGNSEWTSGDLNYLAVYNRVLSDAEIKTVCAGLKGRVGL